MLFFETKINNSNKTAIVGVIFLSLFHLNWPQGQLNHGSRHIAPRYKRFTYSSKKGRLMKSNRDTTYMMHSLRSTFIRDLYLTGRDPLISYADGLSRMKSDIKFLKRKKKCKNQYKECKFYLILSKAIFQN